MLGARIEARTTKADPVHLESLAKIRTTDLSDVMGGSYTISGLYPLHGPIGRLVGPALTVSVPTNSEGLIKYALHSAEPGDIVVVNACGNMSSVLAGSNMMRGFLNRGGIAAIFDGLVRDASEIKGDGLPVFARGVGTAEGPCGPDAGEVNVPVACGGTVVCPGDYVVADDDGVVVVPQASVDEVVAAARKLHERHEQIQEILARGDQANIERIEATLRQAGIAFPNGN